MADDGQTTYEMLAPDGNKYRIPGPPGASDEAVRNQIISQHPHLGDPQFLSDPYLKGFDPHREERGAAGGIYKRAAAAFPGSVASNVEETAGALWTIATNPKEAASALWDMGLSGVASTVKEDLAKHYGNMDRVQRTFEEDPARFLMDALSVGTGGAALLRKLAVGTAELGRAAIPKAAGKLAEVEPEALRAAGEAGEAGGQAAKEYKTGLKTRPQTPGQAIPYYQEAGEAIARGGWMPKHLTRTALGTAAADVLTAGHLPSWATTVAGTTAAAGSSPRLAGATMYGLGAMERRAKELPTMWDAYAAAKVPANRAVIRADAQAILRDKEKKNQLKPDQIKTLRTATRPDADSNAMLAAQRVLTPLSMGAMLPKSPQERINIGHMAAPDYRENNFDAAMSNLKLNKQEQFLYRMHLQNLRSGGVSNPAGGTSTLFMSTFEIDGKTYVIPTVWKGQIVKPDQALAYAKQMGLEKFPSYDSEDEAEKRYNAMHGFMEKDLPTPSSYGGIGGGRSLESTRATAPQTPAPGQPSQPRSPAGPTPPAQMQAPPIGPIEKPSSRFANKLTSLWEQALKGISPISEARAGEVIPIKRSPLKVAPKPQSPATSEAMESIEKMMDALRGPIKRP